MVQTYAKFLQQFVNEQRDEITTSPTYEDLNFVEEKIAKLDECINKKLQEIEDWCEARLTTFR
jgi:hypothetical protein